MDRNTLRLHSHLRKSVFILLELDKLDKREKYNTKKTGTTAFQKTMKNKKQTNIYTLRFASVTAVIRQKNNTACRNMVWN